MIGNSLAVQWLGFWASTAGGHVQQEKVVIEQIVFFFSQIAFYSGKEK